LPEDEDRAEEKFFLNWKIWQAETNEFHLTRFYDTHLYWTMKFRQGKDARSTRVRHEKSKGDAHD
jgi:hypothetical protein